MFIPSVTAGAQRSFLVACSVCGGGYYVAARTVRDMRKAERAPVCRPCRRPEPIDVQPQHRRWAEQALGAMTHDERALVAYALAGKPIEHVPRSDLALAASAARG